ncbi:MAG TPA: permease-like cell division protein FtsX [Clostridia bacterium]|nr:permease-like cell division protein FtsX [Clostridia bacterium]
MKHNVFSYLISEGFRNVFKNKKSTGASLTIMCATLLIFGLVFVIVANINNMVENIEGQQGMRVFINDVSESESKQIGDKIKTIEGVNTIKFVSKADALEENKQKYKNNSLFMEGYTEKNNPFPASYVVTLKKLNLSKEVQTEIGKIANIREITVRDDTIEALKNIGNGIQYSSIVILLLLILISIFIMANTIKLTVHARRKEISIMKYVGATNSFIKSPFIVEGIVIGIISALISIVILGGLYNLVTTNIAGSIMEKMGIGLLSFNQMFSLIIFVYLLMGVLIGTIGSCMSMKKYLKV